MQQGAGAERKFYRAARSAVKSLVLLAMLMILIVGAAGATPKERLDRSRNDEERLSAMIALVAEGRFAEAEEALLASGAVAEQDPRWLNLHGLAVAGQGRHVEAIALYEEGLRRDPGLAALHRNLAISLVQAGGRGRALTEFRQATELDRSDAEAWLGLCTLQTRLRRADDAAYAWTQLRQLAPDDVRTWRTRAALAELQADEGGLREAWEWIEAREPDAESARRLAALSADSELALGHYRDCFERDPGATDCREQATVLSMALGRPGEALVWSEPVLGDLTEPGYLNLLLAALNSSAIGKVEGWVGLRPPASGPAWGVVALARREQGNGPEALEAVNAGLEVAESADLYNLLGVLRVEAGDVPGARRAWSEALELDPDHAIARANLAEHPEGP